MAWIATLNISNGGERPMSYEFVPHRMGWECPKCGRVYSPWVEMCHYCGNGKAVTLNTYTATVNENTIEGTSATSKKTINGGETNG